MDCIVLGVAKSWTRLSDFHFPSLYMHPINRYTCCASTMGPAITSVVSANAVKNWKSGKQWEGQDIEGQICFWIVVLEKTLESPLDCKEIKPVNSKGNQLWIFIQGVMLKLKLQNFGHVMQRADSLENTLILGKIEDKRRRGWQRMRWLNSIISSMDMNLSKCQEIVENREAWFAIIHAVAKSWMWLSDWATPPPPTIFCFFSILLEAPLPPSSVTLLHLNKFHSLLHKASSIYTND